MNATTGSVDRTSSSEAKIALFRSLFRGRDDIYPRRFESRKTGKSGYAPACANEGVRGICEKPRIKCAECPNRRFLPVTDDVIRWHLSGHDADGQPVVAGVYPLLRDETCFFLAVDFDKAGWQEDAAAFLDTCGRLNLPTALERSRSGRGGHVWFFFEEAIPAALARRFGQDSAGHAATRQRSAARADRSLQYGQLDRHAGASWRARAHCPETFAASSGLTRPRPDRLSWVESPLSVVEFLRLFRELTPDHPYTLFIYNSLSLAERVGVLLGPAEIRNPSSGFATSVCESAS